MRSLFTERRVCARQSYRVFAIRCCVARPAVSSLRSLRHGSRKTRSDVAGNVVVREPRVQPSGRPTTQRTVDLASTIRISAARVPDLPSPVEWSELITALRLSPRQAEVLRHALYDPRDTRIMTKERRFSPGVDGVEPNRDEIESPVPLSSEKSTSKSMN